MPPGGFEPATTRFRKPTLRTGVRPAQRPRPGSGYASSHTPPNPPGTSGHRGPSAKRSAMARPVQRIKVYGVQDRRNAERVRLPWVVRYTIDGGIGASLTAPRPRPSAIGAPCSKRCRTVSGSTSRPVSRSRGSCRWRSFRFISGRDDGSRAVAGVAAPHPCVGVGGAGPLRDPGGPPGCRTARCARLVSPIRPRTSDRGRPGRRPREVAGPELLDARRPRQGGRQRHRTGAGAASSMASRSRRPRQRGTGRTRGRASGRRSRPVRSPRIRGLRAREPGHAARWPDASRPWTSGRCRARRRWSRALAAIDSHQPGSATYRVMTAVAYYAGLRPSEIAMLRVRALVLPTEDGDASR